MKIRASVKKRSKDCQIIKRKGKIFVINDPRTQKGRIF